MVLHQGHRKIVELPIEMIVPNPAQPRRQFDPSELESLAESIRQNGLLQPILVRYQNYAYEVIIGERRLRACRLAGLEAVPCIVNDCDDQNSAIYALLENLQRQDLQLFEEAEGLQALITQWGITQEEAARRLGRSQSAIANKLRLLKLTPWERNRITEMGLTGRHARALVRIPEQEVRRAVLETILREELNVAETDSLVDKTLEEAKPRKNQRTTLVLKDYRLFLNTVNQAVAVMQASGIAADTTSQETPQFYEWTVRVPKSQR